MLPTTAEYTALAEASLRASLDPGGTNTPNLTDGSRLTVAVHAMTSLLQRATMAVAQEAANRDVSSADDDGLDVLAVDVYDDGRKAPAKATTIVYLKRSGTGATYIPKATRFSAPAAGSLPAITFLADATQAVTGGTTKVAVPVTCSEVGSKGNIDPSTISLIQDPLPDSTWSLFTPTALDLGPDSEETAALCAGGADLEGKEVLRSRLKSIPADAARQKGLLASVRTGALTVPGVYQVDAIDAQDGSIVLYVGDENYLATDAMLSAVKAVMPSWAAGGVPVAVRRYTLVTVTVTGAIYMSRALVNYDVGAITAAARASIKTYFASRLRPDEYMLGMIRDAMIEGGQAATNDAEVQDATLLAPLADVKRHADTYYAGVTSATRYIVTDASINITVLPPLTR